MNQIVYLVSSDLQRIIEANKHKLTEHHAYFLTYDEALTYLLFIKLENLVDDFLISKGYPHYLKELEKISLQIRELEKKRIIKQEGLIDFTVQGIRVR